MSNQVGSVIIASAQSVAKVYVIGFIGYMSTRIPKKNPLLPYKSVGILANFGFHVLVISLIYSTTAIAISPSSIMDFWFVVVAAFFVIAVSYGTATVLGYLLLRDCGRDFCALRIAAAFPNIVALPILIFPSLCEYPVVYEGFSDSQQDCIAVSNTMIFCYFFSWSLTFYSFGQPSLMAAARMGSTEAVERPSTLYNLKQAILKVLTSPGFLAIVFGFITGCIAPLRDALFEEEGALRFLGGSLETLGQASSPISTMVVAASLAGAPLEETSPEADETEEEPEHNPIMADPNFGPRRRRSSIREFARRRSTNIFRLKAPEDREQARLLLWFILTRLIITPAIVTGIIVGLECSSLLTSIPDLAKLVIIVNSCLPGALVVVVLLKSNDELQDTAAAVARVYLPSYLLSIFSIAGWTALGLYISLPDDEGNTICER